MPGTSSTTVHVARTSLGLQLSAGRVHDGHGIVRHYTLSWSGGEIDPDAGVAIAQLILMLRRVTVPIELKRGSAGVYHLLIKQTDRA